VDSVAEPAEGPEQVVLGVMLFKALGSGGEADWRREALRDALNTQLSQLSQVKVYSKEFIDFLITRKGLTEIEVATQLGISKMLSGSFVVGGGTIRIETHVVDIKTGLLESSHATVGPEADFSALQERLASDVISRLVLPVTEEERTRLLARRTTDEEALKMLMEAEGSIPAPPEKGAPPDVKSALPRWLARLGEVAVGVAYADDAGAQGAILETIKRYRLAMEARDLTALSALYAEFPPEQQAAQQRYFDNARDLSITIDKPDIAVAGDEAVVSYTRSDDFVDARTGRPMHVELRLTKTLRREGGEWKFAGK
jgi:TolB-like protein/ketosteroid isomerase-like protein